MNQRTQTNWRMLVQSCILLFLFSFKISAQTLPPNFQRVTVVSGINSPTAMEFIPDGRILICQKGGQLRVVKNGALLATPAISLSVNTDGERGLIGVTIDPNFATNKFVYLYYSTSGTVRNRVSRFVMTGDLLGSETILINFPVDGHMYHNGGGLAFGKDGKLYILTGDDKVGTNASNLESPFGKVMRINSDGTIPTGNPFTGTTNRSRVWAYGVRNPFTMGVDPVSGKIFINDVGESTWEEINDATTGGKNFGWPDEEGMCTSCPGVTNPIYVYRTNRTDPPTNGTGCAINGGTFLNGAITNYPSTYHGKYFFLDYCGGWIDYINPASPTRNSFATGLPMSMVYLKQGLDGNLYYLNIDNGTLNRIIYTLNQSPAITTQPQSQTVSQGQNVTFTVTATGTPTLTYQWRKDGVNISGATSSTYTITNVQPSHAGQYSAVVSNSFPPSATSNNATLTVTAPNTKPDGTITAPVNGSIFRGGDVITLSGTATDNEDGTLPASAYEWFVDLHHENHRHDGPSVADGVTSTSFNVPTVGNSETNTWYRIYLVVTDSRGTKDTSFVEIFPKTANLTFQTQPAGLQIRLDEVPITTPYATTGISGSTRPLGVVSPQTLNGTTYVFDSWVHGGSASQTINVTDNDVSFTAVYKVAPPAVNLSAIHDAYVRSGTHGATTHGTTDATNLITKRAPAAQADNSRETYLMFDLSTIGGNLTAVQLKLFGRIEDATATNIPVGVFSVANTTWTESAITFNNRPATSVSALQSATVTDVTGRYYIWDITAYAQSERAAGRNRIALALKSGIEHNPRILWSSKETGSNPPVLTVVSEGGNTPPTVSITSPLNGASFTAPATITINANASDANGTISKVDFYNGTTLLGTDLTAPYSFTWSNVSAGSYPLTAKATDNAGAVTTSSVVNITVNAAPTCPPVIASAHDGNVPENVLDNNFATRWSANGDGQWIQFCLGSTSSVTGVDIAFYSGNLRSSRFDVLVGPDGTSWTTAATGLVSSGTSTAFESFNFPAVSGKYVRIVGHGNNVNLWNSFTEVRIKTGTANTPPTVSVTSPANGANFTAPATITINANAADADGTVSKVDFYNGTTLLGTDATAPYSFTWNNVPAGSYTITARATDNAGAVTTSAGVSVTVTTVTTCPWTVMASAHDGNIPENTLDNNLATRWSASGDGQWIQYCLNSTSNVTGVQIAFYNGNLRQSIFDVQVSSDATTWTNAATGLRSSGTSTALETFTFPSRTAKYVRILGHGNSSNLWNSYTEVKINATATSTMASGRFDEVTMVPAAASQLIAYPNPLSHKNKISFSIESDSKTVLSVYDQLGRQVAVLENAFLKKGNYTKDFDASELPGGVYIIQLNVNGKTITQKVNKQ